MTALDALLIAVQGLLLARWLFVLGSAIHQSLRSRAAGDGAGEAGFAPPPVSVVIPAFNEEASVAAAVRSVAQSVPPPREIVVVDDGSTDGTAGVLERLARDEPRLRVVTSPANEGKAAALNRGLRATTSDFVVTVDADTRLDPDALGRLARAAAGPGVGAVAANLRVADPSCGTLSRWQQVEYVAALNLDRRAQRSWGCITTVPGAAAAWRREALAAVGGFSGRTCTEDMDVTLCLLQAGWRVALEDRALAFTETPTDWRALFRQRLRWLYGNLQCAWRHRGALFRPRRAALGFLGLPNVWFAQLLAYLLLPLAAAATVRVVEWIGPWAAAAYLGLFGLDVAACRLAFRLDRSPPAPAWLIASQRLCFPFFALAVFLAAAARWGARRPVGWKSEVSPALAQAGAGAPPALCAPRRDPPG